MIATLRPLTYDDLKDMPDDGQRYEIIGGELLVTPAPTSNHQRVVGRIFRLLDDYARDTDAGEVFMAPFDVHLGRYDAVQPDLVFVPAIRPRVPGEENSIAYPPGLVVEILSPSTRTADRVKKMALYARSGVPEYWIADPLTRTIAINVLDGEEYVPVQPDADARLASRALPGLTVDPVVIFAGLN
jgi:Uma2 family endonuclease